MTQTRSRIVMLAALVVLSAAMIYGGVAGAQEGLPPVANEHKLLAQDVGTWDGAVKLWPAPNSTKPLESKAVEQNELLPGGLWLVSRFNSDFGGAKFAGAGTWGYDPVEKKYVGTWVDNMTPHLSIIKSDYDAATKTMSGISDSRDPISGKPAKTRQVSRYLDADNKVFELYALDPDGKEFKMLEITYKRRAK